MNYAIDMGLYMNLVSGHRFILIFKITSTQCLRSKIDVNPAVGTIRLPRVHVKSSKEFLGTDPGFTAIRNPHKKVELTKMKTTIVSLPFLYSFAVTSVKASGCTDGWNILQSYDLFSIGDVWTSSEVEGKTFIGGDLTSGNSANFGIHLSSTTDVTFEIAGGFAGGNPININKGSLAHSSDVNSFLQNPAVGVSTALPVSPI